MNNDSEKAGFYGVLAVVFLLGILLASTSEVFGCATCGCSKKAAATAAKCGEACEKPSCDAEGAKLEEATINTEGLAALLRSGASLVVLDARSGKWDDGRRIPGAKGVGTNPSAADLKRLVKDKDALIVTYCTNLKCGASRALHGNLKKLGYKNVLEYPPGIEGWAAAKQTIAKKG